jgi:uncharacterized protein (TIGR01244 family)
MDRMKISDTLTVGGQPTEDELRSMAEEGVRTVVNLRTAGEEEQPLSPEEEGRQVEAAGMQYVHIPVSMKGMGPQLVDQFRAKLNEVPGPVFVHCHRGKRAGAFAMMHAAVERGMTGEQTLKQAEQMGFECDVPALKEFVTGYVESHRGGGQGPETGGTPNG